MRAAILAVGHELLGADRVDTNSLRVAGLLARFGVRLCEKCVVGDDEDAIATAVKRLVDSFDVVVVSGGLGPTQDDLTREGVARALSRTLERSSEVLDDLRQKFGRFGLEMPAVNEKQADLIAGAEVIDNSRGTAPGQKVDLDGCTLFLFPGVPTELDGLAAAALEPWLAAHTAGDGLESAILKIACVPESTLEERLAPFYSRWGSEGVALLPSIGQVTIRLDAEGSYAARAEWLEPRRRALRLLLGDDLFAEDAESTLEQVAVRAVEASGLTLATAESCTGGLVAERLTRVPGSSRAFVGSIVSYADRVKRGLLSVPRETLERHGAVSREVALAMAAGAQRRLACDLALAITGIAGPGGGSAEKPIGTVHVVLRGPDGEERHRQLSLPGDRDRVRWMTSQWALEMLRRFCLRLAGGGG